MIHPQFAGLVVAVAIVISISAMLHWMLHPPAGKAERAAREAEVALEEMIGSVIVVFSQEIHSEHMMLLAARLARRERAELLVAYVIEVPTPYRSPRKWKSSIASLWTLWRQPKRSTQERR